MASSRRNLAPGQSTVFTTRPVGLTTRLFVIPWPPAPGSPLVRFSWHIELCCQDDRVENLPEVNISAAAGALVTVRNLNGAGDAQVWTDYI